MNVVTKTPRLNVSIDFYELFELHTQTVKNFQTKCAWDVFICLQKSLGNFGPDVVTSQLREIRAEKEASIMKRKKIDNDLKLLNQDITKKVWEWL